MSRSLSLLSIAEAEAADAIDWYEAREHGLGNRLLESIETTLKAIQRNPLLYPAVEGSKARRALVRDFPFCVVFEVKPDTVTVLSIFHTSRNPMIWQGRID